MDLKPVFEEIDFFNRYQNICKNHQDFENRLRGSFKKEYETILNNLKKDYKYYSNGSFFQIQDQIQDVVFQINLVLKNGIVECLQYIKFQGKTIEPKGRIDFFAEDLNILFDRTKYGLPKYSSLEDLEIILKDLFNIYEDFKTAFINSGY